MDRVLKKELEAAHNRLERLKAINPIAYEERINILARRAALLSIKRLENERTT